jgi:hypothetical protein
MPPATKTAEVRDSRDRSAPRPVPDRGRPALSTAAPARSGLDRRTLAPYLETVLGGPVQVLSLSALGETTSGALKAYGYGTPVLIECVAAGRRRRLVLETMAATPFGHEHMEDRLQVLLWQHRAFNRLPLHARTLDVGGFTRAGPLVSLADVEEGFLLTEYVEGRPYFEDLVRLRDGGDPTGQDLARADALCDYLVRIHRLAGGPPGLYTRRVRELLGHGECIMGLADSYPPDGAVPAAWLEEVERRCVRWRWRLKERAHRLRRVHGDFHPWNILFRTGADFSVLDRSRGEWGDPADDVTALTVNYLFFSLQRSGRLAGGFADLFERFWRRYLQGSGDHEVLEVAAPFFAFRVLVLASPVWYPNLSGDVRRKLCAFALTLLERPAFDPARVDECWGT